MARSARQFVVRQVGAVGLLMQADQHLGTTQGIPDDLCNRAPDGRIVLSGARGVAAFRQANDSRNQRTDFEQILKAAIGASAEKAHFVRRTTMAARISLRSLDGGFANEPLQRASVVAWPGIVSISLRMPTNAIIRLIL